MGAEQTMTVQQMETPHSAVGSFNLPCGYIDPSTQELHTEVEVREITGYEEDMMASDKVVARKKLDLLLGGCVTRIGTISDQAKIKKVVKELPVGDRVYLLFAIRRVTLGDELPIREKCPSCSTSNLFVVDLKDLDVKEMEDRRKRLFDIKLPSGKEVRFRVSTGQDEAKMADIQKRHKNDMLSMALLMRIELLDGEPADIKAIKSLGMRDRKALRTAMEKSEGGVDTALELECPVLGS